MFESSAARIKHLQRVTNTRSLKRCLVDLYRSFLCISLYFQKVCLIILSNFNYDQLFLQTKFVVSHSTAPGTHLRHLIPGTRRNFYLKGKYFCQNFQFFPPPQTKTCQFLLCFFSPTLVKIFIAFLKWRKAPKNFPFLTQNCMKRAANGAKRRKMLTVFPEIVQKKLKLRIERENKEEIYQK